MANKKKKKKSNKPQPNKTQAKKNSQKQNQEAKAAAAMEAELAEIQESNKPKKGYTPPKGKATPSRSAQNTSTGRKGLSPAVLIGGGVAALVGLVLLITTFTGADDSGVVEVGAWDLPVLEGDDPDGDGRATLEEFAGKPLVVNFFASWCTNCESELPRFVRAQDDYGDDVTIVYVNSSETGNWKRMADRTGIRDRLILRDIKRRGSGFARELGGTGAMPLTAYFDANSNLVDVDFGEISTSALDARLAQLGVPVAS